MGSLRKIFILLNPASGKRKAPKALRLLEETLQSEEINYEVFQTQKEKNGWKTVTENLDETFSDLIILGGDGTINEAINGLACNIPVSIVPCGSGNDYVKCLDLGESLKEQIHTAIHGQPKSVDVGICNGRKFLNGVGVGFDGQIVSDIITEKTWIKGAAKYYYHVLKILSSYKARIFDYETEGKQHQKSLILFCVAKGTTFGGAFRLTPGAELDDGKLHICQIGDLKPLKRFLNVGRLGSGSHTSLEEVSIFRSETLFIKEQPQLHAHIDGEYFGNPPFEFIIQHKALNIRVAL